MKVTKRNGTTVEFDHQKIKGAIRKAIEKVGEFASGSKWNGLDEEDQESTLVQLYQEVYHLITEKLGYDVFTVEEIQDVVETVLMAANEPAIAKEYITYRAKRAEQRELEKLVPDPNAIADYIHPSKYARYVESLNRREIFLESVNRVKDMHVRKFPDLEADIDKAFAYVQQKKILPSMRSMQFGGPAIEHHNARIYNCSYTLIDRPRVFSEMLYLLLCGCGCGFSVQKQHVAKLPKIKIIDYSVVKHIMVEDTIIGWATAVEELVNSYMDTGYHVEFSYSGIRPVGSPLNQSGGRAPGHLPLKKLLDTLREILHEVQGRHLRTIDAYDMTCHIAEAVLAGGVRRSSLSALFSYDDEDMLYAKDKKNFQFNGLNAHRAMSNNAVVLLRSTVTKQQFVDVMNLNRENYGDPGFVFMNNLDDGFNPCFEIGMHPVTNGMTGWSFCNLVEINVAACRTKDQFRRACHYASYIATLQAAYTDFQYIGAESKVIVERDALIGVSMTGMSDNPEIALDHTLLEEGARIVNGTNKLVAGLIGINPAKRTTCIKPSGTASLELGGVASGIGMHHTKRYFRRITANPLEAPAQHLKSINPHMVETKPNGDWCITFPVMAPEGSSLQNEVDALDFLATIFDTFDSWIITGWIIHTGPTHNISATVVVKEGQWGGVLEEVWKNRDRVTALSFLPEFSDKGIPFMPREEVVTEADWAKWKHLIKEYIPVDYTKMLEAHDNTAPVYELSCAGGACEVDQGIIEVASGTVIWSRGTGEFMCNYLAGYKEFKDLTIGEKVNRITYSGRAKLYEYGEILAINHQTGEAVVKPLKYPK